MTINLDLVAAISMGLMALCAFTLDIMTSPKESRWWSLPAPNRWMIRITALLFMIRSVNLFGLSKHPGPVVGQVNMLAVVCSISLTITVVMLTVYALNRRLPAKAWDRISYLMKHLRQHPHDIPVPMTPAEVVNIHHAMGQPAVLGTRPDQVAEEAPRYARALRRARRA